MTADEVLASVLLRLNLDVQTPNVAATDFQTRQIVAFMNEAGADIARRVEWSRLYRKANIPAGIWTLPEDFDRMVEATAVRRTSDGKFAQMVTSKTQWAWIVANPTTRLYCHIDGGKLELRPAAAAEVTYLSRNWAGTQARVIQNADELAIPGRVLASGTVYRYLRQKGFPYDDVMAEHEADLLDDAKAERGAM